MAEVSGGTLIRVTNEDLSADGFFEVPDNVTKIGKSAFMGCESLTSVVIPKNVTEIGKDAFYACTSLTSVMIPDSVKQIGGSAFMGCVSLTSIAIPNNVTEIGEFTFSCCVSLTSIAIPNNVTKVDYCAFLTCKSLTSVVIPKNVTEICEGAFLNCKSLTSVVIPKNVTEISEDAFEDCEKLNHIIIENGCDEDLARIRALLPTLYQDKVKLRTAEEKQYFNKVISEAVYPYFDSDYMTHPLLVKYKLPGVMNELPLEMARLICSYNPGPVIIKLRAKLNEIPKPSPSAYADSEELAGYSRADLSAYKTNLKETALELMNGLKDRRFQAMERQAMKREDNDVTSHNKDDKISARIKFR